MPYWFALEKGRMCEVQHYAGELLESLYKGNMQKLKWIILPMPPKLLYCKILAFSGSLLSLFSLFSSFCSFFFLSRSLSFDLRISSINLCRCSLSRASYAACSSKSGSRTWPRMLIRGRLVFVSSWVTWGYSFAFVMANFPKPRMSLIFGWRDGVVEGYEYGGVKWYSIKRLKYLIVGSCIKAWRKDTGWNKWV